MSEQAPDWKEHIVADADVLVGKAVIKGARVSVEFILGLLAQGWDENLILENYPQLHREDIRAVYSYAADRLKDENYAVLRRA